MNKNLAVLALVTLTLCSVATYNAPSVLADWLIDRSGALVKVDGTVLGDNSGSDSSNSGSSGSDDSTSDSVGDESEASPSLTPSPTTSNTEVHTSSRPEERKNAAITKLEMAKRVELEKKQRLLNTQIEARKKLQEKNDTHTTSEIKRKDGATLIHQELSDKKGELIKAQEVKLEAGESLHVEQENRRGEIEKIKIDAIKDGGLELTKNNLKTHSDLELKIGEKNEISVTLPNGKTREISLPDKALERLVSNGIIAPLTDTDSPTDYELSTGKSGEPVYSVKDAIVEKQWGPFKFKTHANVEVAASDNEESGTTTGDVVSEEITDKNPFVRFFARLAK